MSAPCSHCNGSKVSKNGRDECPWCDGFGTYSMMLRVLEATGRLPRDPSPSEPEEQT